MTDFMNHITGKLSAHVDYTRAVISERDALRKELAELQWQFIGCIGQEIDAEAVAEIGLDSNGDTVTQWNPDFNPCVGNKLYIHPQPKAEPVQEPVAWLSYGDVSTKRSDFGHAQVTPLYASPHGLRKAAQMALECLDSLSNADYLDMAGEVTEVGWLDIDSSSTALRKELGND
jgi:hypothetical protein